MNIEKIDVVKLCKNVLARLSAMDYEKNGGKSSEQLIFPRKIQSKGTNHIDRISEQELRLLFIEEFKKTYSKLFYSIETPTFYKFNIGKSYETIKIDKDGRSASLDMCVFERTSDVYNRILNIEFKHKNSGIKNIGKDILKLMQEEQDGAFIHLLENTDSGTLYSVFNKLFKSFFDFQANWNNENKSIQLLILSLKEKTLIHLNINKIDLINLKEIFFVEKGCGNINQLNGNIWKTETIIPASASF